MEQTEILDKNLIRLFETSAGDMTIRNDEVETYLYSLNWENSNLKLSTCLNKDSLQNNKVLNSKLRFVSRRQMVLPFKLKGFIKKKMRFF